MCYTVKTRRRSSPEWRPQRSRPDTPQVDTCCCDRHCSTLRTPLASRTRARWWPYRSTRAHTCALRRQRSRSVAAADHCPSERQTHHNIYMHFKTILCVTCYDIQVHRTCRCICILLWSLELNKIMFFSVLQRKLKICPLPPFTPVPVPTIWTRLL